MGRILRDEKDLVRYDPVPEYSSPPENGSEHRNETSEEFELQVGKKVLFRLSGSGTALNGNVIQFDEAEVRIRTGEREMTLRRDKGSFEILPDNIKIKGKSMIPVSREKTEPAGVSR
jgi:RNase P/RNase MRP subunit p29